MECLQIDWKSLDGSFEKDDFYESIQAPKWIDFTAPLHSVDDHEWFCGRVGCPHERKSALQTLYQGTRIPAKASKESAAHSVAPVSISTARLGVANNKKARGVVSNSLSSLTDLKSTYAKDKVVYHTQLPSIEECKGVPSKNTRWRQASENQNPNRAYKGQDVAFKKCAPFRGTECREKKTKISTASSTALFEQVLSSKAEPMHEASKSTFIFGERDPPRTKRILATTSKDGTSIRTSISAARIHKAGAIQSVASYRNPHLTASLALPLRKSATDPRHPNGSVFLKAEKAAACKPIRVIKDARKRSDRKEESTSRRSDTQKDWKQSIHTALPLNVQESTNVKLEIQTIKENVASTQEAHTQRELKEGETICEVESSVPPMLQQREEYNTIKSESCCQVHFPHSLQCVGDEGSSNNIQTREIEDSIQNTLEKFLENLRLTSHEDESTSNVGKCAFEQRLVHVDSATSLEQDTKQVAVKELDLSECAAKCSSAISLSDNKSAQSLEEEIEAEHDQDNALEQAMVESMRCSSHSEAVSSLNGSEMTALQTNATTNDQKASTNNDEATTKTDQKHVKDWQGHRGTKRKSSELNFKMKHASRDHKHEMQTVSLTCQQSKQPTLTEKTPFMVCGSKDTHEEHHKKLKTTIVPFRLRTEERGALKGLGLGLAEEPRVSALKGAAAHHALRMPSFGHPFRPQRSTKKLTIPREPKFHLSKPRKACPASN